jgi:predicted cupin superfamily sugar epimerase
MRGLYLRPRARDDTKLRVEYQEVNANFRALAEIRFKLLAFVPTVSGLGISLIDQKTDPDSLSTALLAGLGLVVILGIVIYDQRNSQFYNRLVGRAQFLEAQMGLLKAGIEPTEAPIGVGGGQFLDRTVEPRRLFGLLPLWHDLGLGLIYSAAVGGWLFLLARWALLWNDASAAQASRVAAVAAVASTLASLGALIRLATPNKAADLSADEIRRLLDLAPNATCGSVRLTFVSRQSIAAGGLPSPFANGRPLGSALYFLVTPHEPIRLHRIRNDQLYHYYLGDPLEVFLLHGNGTSERVVVGPDLRGGQRLQLLIPGDTFHTARVIGRRPWFLGASTEWPGVEPGDVEIGQLDELARRYPAVAADLRAIAASARPIAPSGMGPRQP